MRFARGFGGLALVLIFGASVVLSGCSGGSGGSGGGNNQSAVLLLITVQGVTTPLWQNVAGSPTSPPVCPEGVFVNSTITFTFSDKVDPLSLPQTGIAIGSISIVVVSTGQGAVGAFTVVDDPAQSAGNHRRVLFSPTPPGNPNAQCSSGLFAAQAYQITIPRSGNSPQVLTIGSQEIQNDATTCFITCGCPNPGLSCVSSFTDPIPGPPYVVSTTPMTGDPSPPPVDPANVAGNTIQIVVSEALNPAGINLGNVRIVNSATGAQVPGTLTFIQAGSIPGLGISSRIDYLASSPLLGSAIYQILFSAAVTDFGGNPIQTSATNPAALLFFQTTPVNFCAQPPLVETFDTVQNKDLVTGALRWIGDGVLQTEFPLLLTGTGVDGAFNPPVSATPTILDTNSPIGRNGFWDFTTVDIPAGATVRIIGPFLAHLRCTGTFTLNGQINVNAGTVSPPLAATPSYDKGPEPGFQNNNFGTNCEANGGVASAGGGPGGTASGTTSATGTQCALRANMGENGFGPTIAGNPNTGAPPNPLYGGGMGGDSGCFPITVAPCVAGDVGGLGGAGGSAGRIGEAGIPRQSTVTCLPTTIPPITQPIAQPSPVPAAMIPPISVQSAGSGGGGGGDHIETIGTIPNNDDQGGGGGGGGGGVRISCVGAYSQGTALSAGTINSVGAFGANAQAMGGGGGSGSGGEVWIQSFSTVTISANSLIDVNGPTRLLPTQGNIGCSNFAAGGGGDGLVQIEAGQGPTPTPSFMLNPVPTPQNGAVFSAPPFQFAGGVVGEAISLPRFTGYGAPIYTSAVEVFSLGTATGATLTIHYEGFQEAVNSTAQFPVHDPATIKATATGGGPITAANISELNGYAFIRFRVNIFYPAPPATASSAILPFVDTITISYDAGLNCP